MRTRVKVTGDEQWARVLRSRAPRIVEEEMKDAGEEAARFLAQEAAKYPAPPPGSSYVRTYALRDDWLQNDPRVVFGGGTLQVVLENTVPWALWTQHPDKQAWMHKGRFKTTEEIEKENEDKVERYFEQGIQKAESRITTEGN